MLARQVLLPSFCLGVGLGLALRSSPPPVSAHEVPRTRKKHVCSEVGHYVHGCSELRIFSGLSHPDFAQRVAQGLNAPISSANIGRFNDGEISIKINTSVRGADVYVVQPTGPPVSETLMELLLMVSALRNASAKRVTAVVPYFGYMRFDGMPNKTRRTDTLNKNNGRGDEEDGDEVETHRTSYLAMADVAKMLQVAGTSRLVTIDFHSSGQSVSEGFFDTTQVEHLRSGPHVAQAIASVLGLHKDQQQVLELRMALALTLPRNSLPRSPKTKELVVVAPHSQCFTKAKKFQALMRDILGRPVGLALVVRSPTKQGTRVDLVGDVTNKRVLIVEDVIDTARSLSRAALVAHQAGATRVDAFASHAVLGSLAAERIQQAPLGKVVVLNTVPIPQASLDACSKLEVVDVAPLVAALIADLHLAVD